MGAASSYKYTKEKRLYLPTLIKTIDVDKKLQIVNKSRLNGQLGPVRGSVEIPMLKTMTHQKASDKKVQFDEMQTSTNFGFGLRRSSLTD